MNSSGGVDCLGLLIGIAAELDLVDREGGRFAARDVRAYSRHPDAAALRRCLDAWLWPVDPESLYAARQIALFEIDGRAQHLGMIGWQDGPTLIHAYAPARKVVEHVLDESWRTRCVARFRLSGEGGDGEGGEHDAGDPQAEREIP